MASMLKRLFAHLFTGNAHGRFPAADMQRIADAIAVGETCHAGEICFAVEGALDVRDVVRGIQARARAIDAFGRLRVWDTAANNGVLIYGRRGARRHRLHDGRGVAEGKSVAPGSRRRSTAQTPCSDWAASSSKCWTMSRCGAVRSTSAARPT